MERRLALHEPARRDEDRAQAGIHAEAYLLRGDAVEYAVGFDRLGTLNPFIMLDKDSTSQIEWIRGR